MTIKELKLLHSILLTEKKRADKASERAYKKLVDKCAAMDDDSCDRESLKEYAAREKARQYQNDVMCLLHTFEHIDFKES